MTVAAFLTLVGLQVLIAASPGPAAVLTIKTAAAHGLRRGAALAFGLAFAIVLWAAAALAGLALLFEIAPWLQTGLRVAGGVFLIWVGLSLWRQASEPLPLSDNGALGPQERPRRAFRLGIYTNLANPKALVYFAAVFTGVMPADPGWALAALILAAIFLVEASWYLILAVLFSRPAPQRLYRHTKAWTDRIFGGVIAALGLRIALPIGDLK